MSSVKCSKKKRHCIYDSLRLLVLCHQEAFQNDLCMCPPPPRKGAVLITACDIDT